MQFNQALVLWSILPSLILVACATPGPDFRRPPQGSLVLDKTVKQEILDRYGPPDSSIPAMINGRQLEVSFYFYPDKFPLNGPFFTRGLYLIFEGNTLIGYDYLSSFPEDATQFDAREISGLREGRDKCEAVVALLGQPTGEYGSASFTKDVARVINKEVARIIIYSYAVFNGQQKSLDTKQIMIICDNNDTILSKGSSAIGPAILPVH